MEIEIPTKIEKYITGDDVNEYINGVHDALVAINNKDVIDHCRIYDTDTPHDNGYKSFTNFIANKVQTTSSPSITNIASCLLSEDDDVDCTSKGLGILDGFKYIDLLADNSYCKYINNIILIDYKVGMYDITSNTPIRDHGSLKDSYKLFNCTDINFTSKDKFIKFLKDSNNIFLSPVSIYDGVYYTGYFDPYNINEEIQ